MEKLGLCPFCGTKAEVIDSRLSGLTNPVFYITCTKCNAQMGRDSITISGVKGKLYFDNKEDVIEAWNRRSN